MLAISSCYYILYAIVTKGKENPIGSQLFQLTILAYNPAQSIC